MPNLDRFLDYAERAFVVLISVPFVFAFVRYMPSHPYSLALVLSEGLAVFMIIIRRPGEMRISAYAFAIGMLGTALPLFARAGEVAVIPVIASLMIMLVGLAINVSAKLALNRSFGLVAANRGIKRGGPYRLVRHPMYLGYMTTQLGFLLSAFSLELLALYAAAWTFQILRVIEEEKLLMLDPQYQEFARAVRYRLIPAVI